MNTIPLYLSKAARTIDEEAPLPVRESDGSMERDSLPNVNFAGRGQMNGREWCGCEILTAKDWEMKNVKTMMNNVGL